MAKKKSSRTSRTLKPRKTQSQNSDHFKDDEFSDEVAASTDSVIGEIEDYFDTTAGDDIVVEEKPAPKPTAKKGKRKPIAQRRRRAFNLDEAAKERSRPKTKAERGKVTKKGKQQLKVWSGESRAVARDKFFQASVDEAKAKFGGSVMAGSDTFNLVVGIPLPSLSLEFVLQQDAFPLSVVVLIRGKWRTCKSALLYEIFRWFAKCNGGAILNEAETKFSPDLCHSIMDFSAEEIPLILNRCDSLEDWQEYLTYFTAQQKKRLIGTADNPGPGRTIPICFGVDSLMGKASREVIEKIEKEGSASRNFPVEALKISQYIRNHAHKLDKWPFALVLTNHLKHKINVEMGSNEDRMSGGEFVSFQQSFELETSRWKGRISTADFEGVGIRIACTKNSFGDTGRKVKSRMLWWDEHIEGELDDEGKPLYRQKTVWDWDWSTVNMLHELESKYRTRLKEFDVDLEVKSPTADVGCMANCRAVGMGKNEFLSFSEVGALIRRDAEVSDRIRGALGIKRRALMEGDYLEQLQSMAKDLA